MIDALSLPDAADATSALPPLPRKASCPTNAKPDAWCNLRSEFGCAKSKTVRAYCAFTCADARMRGSSACQWTDAAEKKQAVRKQVLRRSASTAFGSVAEVLRRCPRASKAHLQLIRVPKTGSTTLLRRLNSSCGCDPERWLSKGRPASMTNATSSARDRGTSPSCRALWNHQAAPSRSCDEFSIATLREPCERFLSIFHHLQTSAFPPRTTKNPSLLARFPNLKLDYESLNASFPWLLRMPSTADRFATEVAAHWASLMAVPLSWTARSTSPLSYRHYPLQRHLTVLLPQSLWIRSSFTALVCLPRLDDELPVIERLLGCTARGRTRTTTMTATAAAGAATAHERGTNHTHSTSSGGAHAAPGGSGASSEYDKSYLSRLRLSPRGCATVRRLYAEDAALWDRSCGRAAARARPPPAARM